MLAVQAGIGIAVLMQPGDLLLALGDHLVAVAELQGVGLASGNASRRHAMGHAVGATRAFVDDGLVEKPVGLVARDIERASAVAVLAADALVLVDLHETGLLVAHERASRAHRRARGVLAVHALQRHGLHPHVRVRADLALLVADEVLGGQQVVLALAGHAARVAADALLRVDEHSVASHYAPTFLMLTTVSCVQAAP